MYDRTFDHTGTNKIFVCSENYSLNPPLQPNPRFTHPNFLDYPPVIPSLQNISKKKKNHAQEQQQEQFTFQLISV